MNEQKPVQSESFLHWLAQAPARMLFKLMLFFVGIFGTVVFITWLLFSGGLEQLTAVSRQASHAVSASQEFSVAAQPGLVEMQVDGVNHGTIHRLDPPVAVEVGGFTLSVASTYLNQTTMWNSLELPANQVGWLENSVVNYVFRVPHNRGYQEMLAQAGTEQGHIRLITARGNIFEFALDSREQRSTVNREQLLQQKRPSITLVWLDEAGQNSEVLMGSYAPDSTAVSASIAPATLADSVKTGPAQLNVQLDGVDIESNGHQLIVRGSVVNSGLQEGIIDQADFTLASGELRSQLLSIEPPLPWRVSANNSQMVFTAVFQKPPEAEAILTIDDQSFALSVSPEQ